jgi:O-antigen/teichoic acid export membrane protein
LQFSGAKLVHIFLGDQWAAITPILQAMSIFYLFNSLGDLMYVLFNAIGKPKLRLELDTIKIFFTLILIIYLTNHLGIFGTALALIFGLLPSLLLSLRRLTQVTAVTIKDVIGSVWVPFCLSLLLSLPALLWREQIIQLPIIVMISLVVITGLAYISLTWILGKHLNAGPYKTLRLILQHILPKTKEVSSLG